MANLTALQVKINGTYKRIEKLQAKITRLEGINTKKQAQIDNAGLTMSKDDRYWLEADIKWNLEDIGRATRELGREEKKLADYKAQHKAESDKEASIPTVPAVEEFLAGYRVAAEKHIRAEIAAVKPYKESIKDLPYNERCKKLRNRFTADIMMYAEYYKEDELNKKLAKELDNDVRAKRADLFIRCSAKCGLITDASGLYVGNNGSLNGWVVGEEGRAEVETIYAGGHNIQCLHYRVLVK